MRWLYLILAGVALLAVGFAFGRYVAPEKVVDHEVEVFRDRVIYQKARWREETKRTVVVRDRMTRPDGTETTHEVEQTDTRIAAAERIEAAKTSEAVREQAHAQDSKRPDWRAGPVVGVDLKTGALGYGASVERRILGPFSVRVWGIHTGVVGASVTLEF